MKKSNLFLVMMLLSLSVAPGTIIAAEKNATEIASTTKEVPAEVKTMLNRLEEIKAMDKSSMTSVEKKELRVEVRTIKAELRSTNNGVYLSVGAIIIIILLLIILL